MGVACRGLSILRDCGLHDMCVNLCSIDPKVDVVLALSSDSTWECPMLQGTAQHGLQVDHAKPDENYIGKWHMFLPSETSHV